MENNKNFGWRYDKKGYDIPKEIKFCKRCVMSNQRPRIIFDEEGVCGGCRNHEIFKNSIDWDSREKELVKLLDRYRRNDGRYDVIVPSSGGKDSSFVAHQLKFKYGGTEVLRLASNGRVGINSSIPAATLDIHDLGSTGPCLLLRGASITEGDIVTVDGEALGFGQWNVDTSTYTERLRIGSDGDIGIGTHSPDGRLHITSGDSGDCEVIIEADGENIGVPPAKYTIFPRTLKVVV